MVQILVTLTKFTLKLLNLQLPNFNDDSLRSFDNNFMIHRHHYHIRLF